MRRHGAALTMLGQETTCCHSGNENKDKGGRRGEGGGEGERGKEWRERAGRCYLFFWSLPPPLRDCLTEEGGGRGAGGWVGVGGAARNAEWELREVGVVRESCW
jgi:hypothetical protein